MLALIRLLLRFVWLTVLILGVRRAAELAQGGAAEFIERLEEGEGGPAERLLARLHDALHHRQANQTGGEDEFGEM